MLYMPGIAPCVEVKHSAVMWSIRLLPPFCLFFSFYTAHAQCAPAAPTRIPVVLSTDVGNEVDDQWTIVYALTSPRLEVLGVMSAHAPTLSPPAGHTSYHILLDVVENRLRMSSHPPLVEGASLPLEDTGRPRPSPAAKFLMETSRKFSKDHRLTILMIGAATDVASAILLDPTIIDRVRIIAMGYQDWPQGGDEFNVLNDVKAAQVIMGSGAPLVVGSARACRESLAVTLGQAKEMVGGRGPVGRWLWEEFQAWYYRFVKPLRKDDYSKPWGHLGQHRGRLRPRDDPAGDLPAPAPKGRWEFRAQAGGRADHLDNGCRRGEDVGRLPGLLGGVRANARGRSGPRREAAQLYGPLRRASRE